MKEEAHSSKSIKLYDEVAEVLINLVAFEQSGCYSPFEWDRYCNQQYLLRESEKLSLQMQIYAEYASPNHRASSSTSTKLSP